MTSTSPPEPSANIFLGLVFTPSTIVALVLLLVFVVIVLGTLAAFTYRQYFRIAQSMTTSHASCDLEAHVNGKIIDDVETTSSHSLSLWAKIKRWYWPDEPELPWPVYAVHPSLRPKGPLHRRVFHTVIFWRKEDIKREPFTITDVLRAMDEIEAKEQAANTPPAVDVDYAERGTSLNQPLGWWKRLFFRAQLEVPEIIIHPCDGTPSFSYDGASSTSVASPDQPPPTVHYASTPSTPPTPSVSPMSSPALSEPDSPGPMTPTLDHSSYFPTVYAFCPEQCLEVPMPSPTARLDEATKEKPELNVSNVSGNQFVLAAPPKDDKCSRRGGFVASVSQLTGPVVGLGFGCLPAPDVSTFHPAPTLKDDNDDTLPSMYSESSVADLISILDSITSSSSESSSSEVVSSSASDYSSMLAHSRKCFGCIIEVLPRFVIAGSDDEDDCYDDDCYDDDCYDDDNTSIASGETDYYECSSDSSFELGLDRLKDLGPNCMIACSS